MWKIEPARAEAGPERRGGRAGGGDPRDELVIPRDYDHRPAAEPANDDIPF